MGRMVHVVLVYQREAGRLLLEESYAELHPAMLRRFELERDPAYADMEIVVLSADSMETLRRTHGRYFLSSTELIQRLTDTVNAR